MGVTPQPGKDVTLSGAKGLASECNNVIRFSGKMLRFAQHDVWRVPGKRVTPFGMDGVRVKMKTSKKQKRTGGNTKRRKKPATVDYKDVLFEKLRDLDYAAGYLTACYEEGPDVFLLGLRDVAEATGGLRNLADETSLNRENLYDMLSREGNPRLSSLSVVLSKLGLNVAIQPKPSGSKAA